MAFVVLEVVDVECGCLVVFALVLSVAVASGDVAGRISVCGSSRNASRSLVSTNDTVERVLDMELCNWRLPRRVGIEVELDKEEEEHDDGERIVGSEMPSGADADDEAVDEWELELTGERG